MRSHSVIPSVRMVACLVLTTLLVACGSATTAPATTAPATTPTPAATGGTLRVAYGLWWGGAESIDPLSAVPFLDAVNILYDRLVRLDATGKLVPELATAWSANADATVWTFTLREGVTFHNSAPFTSADVAYSIKRLLDPAQEAGLAGIYQIIKQIETPDPRTVVFTLAQPHAELPVLFTIYRAAIIPAESSASIAQTGIGTGAFQLAQLNPTGTTRMTAYAKSWRGAPKLDAIELIGIADADARFQALQAGQIDVLLETSPQQLTALKDNPAFVVQTFPGGIWYSLTMRTDTPPFNDVRVRRALRLLVDRQQILTLVQQGMGSIACDTTVWSGDPYRWQGSCPQDLAQARKLLAEAGYPNGLDLTLFTSDSLSGMTPLAEVYQQQAALAGVRVTIKQVPADSYWTETYGVEPFVIDGEYQYPADLSLHLFYGKGGGYNVSKFDDPAFEQLLAEARATLDPQQRSQRYQQAQQYLLEQDGTIIPFHANEEFSFSRRVAGLQTVPYIDMRWDLVTLAAK